MANNKIQLADGTVLLDLTGDTAVASDVAQGKKFHLANGVQATGTNTGGGGGQYTIFSGKNAPSEAQNGDFWVDVSEDISGIPDPIVAGDTPVLTSLEMTVTKNTTSISATGIYIIVPKAGTYRFKFTAARTATSGTFTTQLYKNGTAVSGATATWSSRQAECTEDIACAANDRIEIYARSGSNSNYNIVGQLIACIDWEIRGA